MEEPVFTPLEKAIAFCGSFEAELLVRLMMEQWDHPLRGDAETVVQIVEFAAEVLQRSKLGEKLIEELEPDQMNFIAAVWYTEYCQAHDEADPDTPRRREWIEKIRRTLPSCFCDPSELGD